MESDKIERAKQEDAGNDIRVPCELQKERVNVKSQQDDRHEDAGASEQKDLPFVRRQAVVQRFHRQCEAPPYCQLYARCHSYDPRTEKTAKQSVMDMRDSHYSKNL